MTGAAAPLGGAGVQPDPYVKNLIDDARLIADYQSLAGQSADGTLHDAIDKVIASPTKAIGSPEVVTLRKAFSKSMETVPFSTLLALRAGWRPGQSGGARGRFGILAVLSVLMMIAIGNLSQTYNRGVVLLSEIKTLSTVEPTRRYGELIRQLIESRAKISAEPTAANDEQKLRLAAYFQTFEELRSLDLKLSSLALRVKDLKDSTAYPIAGAWTFLYVFYSVQKSLGIAGDEATAFLQPIRRGSLPQQQSTQSVANKSTTQGDQTNIPSNTHTVTLMESTCPSLKADDQYAAAQAEYIEGRIGGPKEFAKLTQQYIYEMSYLRCFQSFQAHPNYLPDLDTWAREISDRIAPYNLWILPSLFGAIGAIIFYLRLIVNPLQPNPSGFRIVHRVAFGALAGMALAWFWVPEVRFGIDIPNVGFGLFAMAFIVGFSLDVFFTLLDRMVALANTAVGNIGTDRAASN